MEANGIHGGHFGLKVKWPSQQVRLHLNDCISECHESESINRVVSSGKGTSVRS